MPATKPPASMVAAASQKAATTKPRTLSRERAAKCGSTCGSGRISPSAVHSSRPNSTKAIERCSTRR